MHRKPAKPQSSKSKGPSNKNPSLSDLLTEMRTGFKTINNHLEAHDKQFETQDKRFAEQDKRFEAQDKRADIQDKRLENIETQMFALRKDNAERFDGQDKRFAGQDKRLENLKIQMIALRKDNIDHHEKIMGVLDGITVLLRHGPILENHEKRIEVLEQDNIVIKATLKHGKEIQGG